MEYNIENSNFDAIVIGSGIGGFTTAAILSRFNCKKVLIVEQCFNPGGQTQSFHRKGGFVWDTGLQYVGEMAEGQLGKQVFDYITECSLLWKKIGESLILFVNNRFPGFKEIVISYEVSTPLTISHFLKKKSWINVWNSSGTESILSMAIWTEKRYKEFVFYRL